MKGLYVIEKLFLGIMEWALIHVIPAPAWAAAHGCTAASGFGFSAEPWSSAVDGWSSKNRELGRGKKKKTKGRDVGFGNMVRMSLYGDVGIHG